MTQAQEIIQHVQVIQQEYGDRPQLMIAVLAGFSLFVVAATLCVIAVGSIGLLANCAGLIKDDPPARLPERHKIRVLR